MADEFARGIQNVLEPPLLECEQAIIAAQSSQSKLSAEIDRLCNELDKAGSDDFPAPDAAKYLDKIAYCKRNIAVVSNGLTVIFRRLDQMRTISQQKQSKQFNLTNNEKKGTPLPTIHSHSLPKLSDYLDFEQQQSPETCIDPMPNVSEETVVKDISIDPSESVSNKE